VAVAALTLCAQGANATAVFPESSSVQTAPGSTVSVKWFIQSDIPLLGYSLAIERQTPITRDFASVEIDAALTNFFDPQNLITAGGETRDPLFSVINPDGSGGVFISTNTEDLSTVLPVPGVNNVLGEVVFNIGADAKGDWVFKLGSASALADENGSAVPFDAATLTISIIPSPGSLLCILCGVGQVRRRTR